MSKDEVLEAVKAAEEAFPAWSNTPPKVSQMRRRTEERGASEGMGESDNHANEPWTGPRGGG